MKFRLIPILIILLSVNVIAFCEDLSNNIPTSMKVAEQTLKLNGTGVRTKFMIDLFTGALYLKNTSHDGNLVTSSNEAMAMKIVVTSNVITSKRLESNMRSEFKRVTNGDKKFKKEIDNLVKTFKEDVNVGDTYDLVYDPQSGLNIYKNKELKTQINNFEFKKVLFSIWFGEDPQDELLKEGMLGLS